MIQIQSLTFNPFAENTFVLFDETKECIIIDPGCYEAHEEETLAAFVANNDLKPVRLINTHCHIDHVLGVALLLKNMTLGLNFTHWTCRFLKVRKEWPICIVFRM